MESKKGLGFRISISKFTDSVYDTGISDMRTLWTKPLQGELRCLAVEAEKKRHYHMSGAKFRYGTAQPSS